jgi:toxin-antitoxin system PIN domain toxin
MASLVDVNLLLALLHERHVSSPAAVAWLDQQTSSGSVVICRVVQMGALRILTRPSIMEDEVLAPAQFWRGWSTLLQDDRFVPVNEPEGCEAGWRKLTQALPAGQCAETDAYLAAFALAGSYRLATFDKGFQRYFGLSLTLLTS